MFKKLNQFKQMKKVYSMLSKESVKAEGAGGKIVIEMNGAFQIINVSVDESLLDVNKKKDIEKGIKQAMQEAIKQLFKKLAEKKDAFSDLQGLGM